MKKAFDSVSKPLILLCWQRLGVPNDIAHWLIHQDDAGNTIVRTPYTLELWDIEVIDCVQPLSFNGDIHSPFTWLAVLTTS